ncbi:MAG TPA: hypothetical protein VGL32_12050 [Acidimicrobiales bacterium]
MLLLLTVGLLLIGLVTLVIGFLNSSLALDYISIAASALSFALVLLFTRLGRARSARSAAARGSQAPPPLAHSDTGVIELDHHSDSLGPETATIPRASRGSSRAASRGAEPPTSQAFDEPALEEVDEADEADEAVWEPQPPPPPVPARSTRGPSPYERPSTPVAGVRPPPAPAPDDRFEDDRYEDDRHAGPAHVEEYEDLEFPIADYDELRVAEILPLLEELEPDEIEVVRDRETSGRNRGVVVRKLDELTGAAGAGPAARRPAAPVANGIRQRPTVEAPVDDGYEDEHTGYDEHAEHAAYDHGDDEYDDEGRDDRRVAFPIADYDDLRLTEILPLLPQLEPTELELVRQRELQGERRATLLNRIDALIGTGTARAPARQGR